MIPAYPMNLKKCLALSLSSWLMLSAAPVGAAVKAATPASDIPPGLGITTDGSAGIAEGKGRKADTKPSVVPAPGAQVMLPESPAVERILWDKTPIKISLNVGCERLVTFPGTVRLGVPNTLMSHLRTQSQNGTVYWLASEPFAATRIQIQDTQSGQFYLVDLSATATAGSNTRIEIINATTPGLAVALNAPTVVPELLRYNPDSPAAPVEAQSHSRKNTPTASDYTLLTRYAAQQLYAPARLLKTPPGIHSAPLNQAAIPNGTLMRGGALLAEPVAAWRKGTLYVTAVKLSNQSLRPVVLDPRLIRGQWRTATFQHARLSSAAGDDNVTALYLVSDRPFAEVSYAIQ